MATIRELVQSLAERDGVDAVVVLGPDGIPIDSAGSDTVAATIAAMIPRAVSAYRDLGQAAGRGAFSSGVVEYDDGLLVICQVRSEAWLAVSVRAGVNIGSLLHDLRRERPTMAALF